MHSHPANKVRGNPAVASRTPSPSRLTARGPWSWQWEASLSTPPEPRLGAPQARGVERQVGSRVLQEHLIEPRPPGEASRYPPEAQQGGHHVPTAPLVVHQKTAQHSHGAQVWGRGNPTAQRRGWSSRELSTDHGANDNNNHEEDKDDGHHNVTSTTEQPPATEHDLALREYFSRT